MYVKTVLSRAQQKGLTDNKRIPPIQDLLALFTALDYDVVVWHSEVNLSRVRAIVIDACRMTK